MAKNSLSSSELLVKHGFIKSKYRAFYRFNEKAKTYHKEDGIKGEHADEEVTEEVNVTPGMDPNVQYVATGFPKPYKRFKLILEAVNQSIEETYYWVLNHIRVDMSFPYVEKITDIFSASENSAFFGQSAQRLGIQQDRASQYLATVGKLTKDIFPMVRELRIMDERLEIYDNWEKSKSADITLKGLFIDFAEGGTKNPASVYGLAQQVGFTILPDLFFNTHVTKIDQIDSVVDGMRWNLQVKNILKRKLYQYVSWANRTGEEVRNRRKFTLMYLRQHWNIVKMYISWIKPYLRTVRRLTMNEKQIDSPDLINAFESSMTEIEILAKRPYKKGYWSVILATFNYRTRPTMSYRQDYQQGPIHVGRVQFELRAYGWTDEQIEAYKRMKEDEELQMIGVIDASLKEAMDAYSEEIQKYLEEAGEAVEKKEEKKPKKGSELSGFNPMDPFVATAKGFGELFGSIIPIKIHKKDSRKGDPSTAKGAAIMGEGSMYQVYKNYKKAHKMFAP